MQDQFSPLDGLQATSPYGESWDYDDPRFEHDDDAEAAPTVTSTVRVRKHRALAEARAKRDRLVADLSPLAELGINPSGPPLSRSQASLLLGLLPNTIRKIISRNADELNVGDESLLDATAVARIALLTRHSASPMVGRIHRSLDPDADAPMLRFADREDGPTPTHRASAEAAHDEAYEVIEAVRDQDPAVVWERIRGMAPEQAAAVIVVLAALVPDNQRGLLNWVRGLSPAGTVSAGLCQIIPTPQTAAHGRSRFTEITDAELGL